MMITGSCGYSSFACCSSFSPDSPGMRISLTITCGASAFNSASASSAEANDLKAMLSRVSAFSSTQRMERSSSMIQTGFIFISVNVWRSAESAAEA